MVVLRHDKQRGGCLLSEMIPSLKGKMTVSSFCSSTYSILLRAAVDAITQYYRKIIHIYTSSNVSSQGVKACLMLSF